MTRQTTAKPLPYPGYAHFRHRYARATDYVDRFLEGCTWHMYEKVSISDEKWQKYKFLVKYTHNCIELGKIPPGPLHREEVKAIMEIVYARAVQLWDACAWGHCPESVLLHACVAKTQKIVYSL